MKTGTGPERAGSLVVELAARTAIIDGVRIELPPTEFALLAVLAARPGQIVSHKELAAEAFGEGAAMAPHELHWRIHKVRKLVGDDERDHKMIGNRRGQGYVLDMPITAVEVLEGVSAAPTRDYVIKLDRPMEDTDPESEAVLPAPAPAPRLRLGVVALASLVAIAALGASWFAGYVISRSRDQAPPTAAAPQDGQTDNETATDRGRRREPDRDTKKDRSPRRQGSDGAVVAQGGSTSVSSGVGMDTPNSTTDTNQSGSKSDGDGGDKDQPAPPPPPQPDAQLYHLVNSETGDHVMTTSSSVANQKQAAGYNASIEGAVFSSQEQGTSAIALDSGSAYVYREPGAAPNDVTVAALYKLTLDGEFFYTSSSSAANQAQAQGWTRSTVGYVVV